mmetsp:Transcript_9376/g.14767  ORF Transcript_9376/g.14767 Transcript_9376/m.14767 type:complete len:90 (+) Transcript_9376:674-943(+)
MQKILQEFEKQSEIMDSKQEMMDEVVDDAFEVEDEEGQAEEVVGQVLAEIGIDLGDQMSAAPGHAPAQAAAATEGIDADLEERLKNLRS